MKRLIPSQIKEESTVVKGLTMKDILIILVALLVCALIVASTFNRNLKIVLILVIGCITVFSVIKIDMVKGYRIFYYMALYALRKKRFGKTDLKKPFGIEVGQTIKTRQGYCAVIEVFGIDFGVLAERTQDDLITRFADAIKEVKNGKLVKLDKPLNLKKFVEYNNELLNKVDDELNAIIADESLSVEEVEKRRAPLINKRNYIVNQLEHLTKYDDFERIAVEAYYFIMCEDDEHTLLRNAEVVCRMLTDVKIEPKLLTNNELNAFIKLFLTNDVTKNFNEESVMADDEIEFSLDSLVEKPTKMLINGEEYRILCLGKYPYFVGNAWAHKLFNIPETKVVLNFSKYVGKPFNTVISKSMVELRARLKDKNLREDEKMNIEVNHASLERLMQELNYANEILYNTECYVMLPKKYFKEVMKTIKGDGIKVNDLIFTQYDGWLSMLPFLPMPMTKKSNRERVSPIQSSSIAASFPYVSKLLLDDEGAFIGNSVRHPVFFNPFLRNDERVNSNMVTLGKTGGGKSFWQKKLISASACQGKKIFILDPDNEYQYNCDLMGGNWLDVAGERSGKINPLQVFPHLREGGENEVGDVSSHRIFLGQFFKTVCPQMSEECVLFLNDLLGKLYAKFNITDNTDITKLKPADFPIFDDFRDFVVLKLESGTLDEAETSVIKRLLLYIEQFSDGGIYARLWNGPTTLEIKNNFNVLNFQSLFMNNNKVVSNGQMLLLMRFLNQEIIKNREYNETHNANQKIMIIIDEAHRFINPDYPVALEFMSTMAKQIRKYNGSLNVATQNISDFVGVNDNMKAMATAVINACQYSMIFGLSADDLNKVKELYANYNGGLTEVEIDFISRARRGDALLMIDQNVRIPLHIDYFVGERYFIDGQETDDWSFKEEAKQAEPAPTEPSAEQNNENGSEEKPDTEETENK